MRKFRYLVIISLLNAVVTTTIPGPGDTRGIKIELKTPRAKTTILYRDSYALLIGNGNYKNGWDPLPGALRDVNEVASALERQGFKVTLETDLTRPAFNRVFGEFILTHGEDRDNRLLFYYAGHGHTQTMANGEEMGFLVMVDAPLPGKDLVSFSLASVDMQTLVTQAKLIQSKHALFMFDSCFSGTILNLRSGVAPNAISDSVRYPVRQFITAGRANEPVPDYSVFKQAFLDLLEGRAPQPIPDGYITGEELALYLKTKVPEYNPAQHPQYGKIRDPKLDKGDFVFLATTNGPEVQPDVENARTKNGEAQEKVELASISSDDRRAERARLHDDLKNEVLQTKQSPPDSRYKLAVFPWRLRGSAIFFKDNVLDSLKKAIENADLFDPVFSYYDLGKKYETKAISNSLINDRIVDEMWIKRGFWSKSKLNTDLIYEIGAKLNVDVVLLYSIAGRDKSVGETELDPIEVFLVDLNNKKTYHVNRPRSISTYQDSVNLELELLTNKVLTKFESERPSP